MKNMNHGSLFSGIGGTDLAAQCLGWNNIFNCEIDEFCSKILEFHFPNTKHYSDIKKVNFYEYKGKIDVLSGGFPCQPFSMAGKRKGANDDRYLWPEMLRAIQEISPSWIVGENVRGIINSNDGLVFEQICSDLEAENYEIQPFILPAASVNAPHKRERVWFIACNITDSKRIGWIKKFNDKQIIEITQQKKCREVKFSGTISSFDWWQRFPISKPNVRGGNDGIPFNVDSLAIPFNKWKQQSIKAYGNAIVPQLAYRIFNIINIIENEIYSIM